MPDRPNPLKYQAQGPLRLGPNAEEEKRTINTLINDGLNSDRHREGWLDKQRWLTRLRYGIRPQKTFPWPNASNLSIPFIDQVIRKFKPVLMRLLIEPDPVVEFVGEDPAAVEQERIAETVFNWLFKTEMDAIDPMAYVVDTMCHRGFAFAQIGWDYATEFETRIITADRLPLDQIQDPNQLAQALALEFDVTLEDPRTATALQQASERLLAGEPSVSVALKRVVRDRPALWDRDPVQVIEPVRTTDIANAEWLIIQHVFSIRKIMQMEADGFFVKGFSDKIIRHVHQANDKQRGKEARSEDSSTFAQSLSQQKALDDQRERIWGHEDDSNILLWEHMHWHDYNNDGLAERVVTWTHPKTKTKGRSAPYAYPFDGWPLVKFDFEKTSRRWHSPRGISEMLMDLQMEVNQQHNARIDGMTLRNAPIYQTSIAGAFKGRNLRAVPGTVLELPAGSILSPLVQDRGSYPEQVNEENLIRTIGENYIGVFDSAITSPASQTRARTATEISAVVQYTAATSTLDAILFQLSMKKVYTMIWQLFMELGPPEILIKVPGADPSTNEPALKPIQKSQIRKRYKLIPTGTVANTNRAIELQNAREAMAMYVNDISGFINPHQLRQWHISLLAQPRWARRILNSPDQAASLVQLQQAAAATNDPNLRAAAGLNGGGPPPSVPRQEIANAGQDGVNAQRP